MNITGRREAPQHQVVCTPDEKCALSIIVPTFNSSGSILKCLESIERQTFKDYEVLIQDGNSTDGTLEIIRAFQEAKPAMVIRPSQEADTGVYDAMNKALQRCRGEWLYFLGSDDELYDENVLARMLQSPQAATADVLYGNVKMVGETPWFPDGAVYDGPFDLNKFLKRNISHQAIFYRSTLIERIGEFNTSYIICADWDLNMRCWAQTPFVYLDVVVARFHTGGTSTQGRPDTHFTHDFQANVLRYFGVSRGMVSLRPRIRFRIRNALRRASFTK